MNKKRRTKRKKIASQAKAVNSQFQVSFNPASIKNIKTKRVKKSEQFEDLGSIKKDLIKSLIISSLIVGSIVMLYWFSRS